MECHLIVLGATQGLCDQTLNYFAKCPRCKSQSSCTKSYSGPCMDGHLNILLQDCNDFCLSSFLDISKVHKCGSVPCGMCETASPERGIEIPLLLPCLKSDSLLRGDCLHGKQLQGISETVSRCACSIALKLMIIWQLDHYKISM